MGRSDEPSRDFILTSPFLRLAAIAMLCSACVIGTAMHLVPSAGQFGIDRVQAAQIAGRFGVASLTARLAIGMMIDRCRRE